MKRISLALLTLFVCTHAAADVLRGPHAKQVSNLLLSVQGETSRDQTAPDSLAQEPTDLSDDGDEFDPYAPDAEEQLKLQEEYAKSFGDDIYPQGHNDQGFFQNAGGCFQDSCAVWARVNRSEHVLDIFLDGQHYMSCPASTGRPGRSTPRFEGQPNGRIYWAHSSINYPGGNFVYRGQSLGNMPFAVFFLPKIAIHGTPKGNWKYLGKRAASHGCIRVHPACAIEFRQLVLNAGIRNVWISVK